MLLGGHGNVSVTANVAPRAMHELCMAAIAGNATRGHARSSCSCCRCTGTCSSNPARRPTKWAMARLGLCGADAAPADHRRSTPAGQAAVEQALREAGLL